MSSFKHLRIPHLHSQSLGLPAPLRLPCEATPEGTEALKTTPTTHFALPTSAMRQTFRNLPCSSNSPPQLPQLLLIAVPTVPTPQPAWSSLPLHLLPKPSLQKLSRHMLGPTYRRPLTIHSASQIYYTPSRHAYSISPCSPVMQRGRRRWHICRGLGSCGAWNCIRSG